MKTQTQCKVKFYRNRYGGYGIVPEDSTLIGSAVDIAVCRTKEDAQDICNALNTQADLIAACKHAIAAIEDEKELQALRGNSVHSNLGAAHSALRQAIAKAQP